MAFLSLRRVAMPLLGLLYFNSFARAFSSMAALLSGSITGGSVSFADLGSTDDAPTLSAKNSESLLEEFEIEVEEKVKQMRSLTERLALRLDRNFQLELLKLPPSIRSMTMQEFCVQFGGDVDEALKQQSKRSKLGMPPPPPGRKSIPAAAQPPTANKEAPASSRRGQPAAAEGPRTTRKAGARAAQAETPGAGGGRTSRSRRGAETPGAHATPGPRGMQTPGAGCGAATPMWTPRVHETPRFARGNEIALSQNGSPILQEQGVKATVKRGRAQATIGFMTANGTEIDLTVGGARAACPDDESRAEAMRRLDELEKQVQAIKGELAN